MSFSTKCLRLLASVPAELARPAEPGRTRPGMHRLKYLPTGFKADVDSKKNCFPV